MKKQYVIAGIVVLIVLAGGVFVFTQKKDTPKSDSATTAVAEDNSQDSDKKDDLGACTMVDKSTIKSSLGSAADKLGGPQDTGVTSLGDGDKGQTCVYPFAEGGSVSNSFYIDVASYASQETFDDVTQYSSDGTTVDVGDVAYFRVSEPITSKSKEFTLSVQKDKKVILFVISQPADALTFTSDTAQSALTQIAKSAKL